MGQTDVQEEEHAGVRSTVERFIPRMLTRQLEESSEAGCVPTCFEVECAVLFLDLSGFVSLSSFLDTLEEVDENISSHTGERVRKLLNSYFEEVVDIFISYGGDVLKYAGDAILVAFERETLQESAQAACESALQVQSTLDHYDVGYFGKKLRAKITIACGNLTCLHIGGVGGRWEVSHSRGGTVLFYHGSRGCLLASPLKLMPLACLRSCSLFRLANLYRKYRTCQWLRRRAKSHSALRQDKSSRTGALPCAAMTIPLKLADRSATPTIQSVH